MATEQGIKYLKFEVLNNVPIFSDDWIARVDYKGNDYDNKNNYEYVDEEQDYKYDNWLEDEEAYDRINQEEINKLFSEPSNVNDISNANTTDNDNPLANFGNIDGDEVPGESTSVRPTRNWTKPEW